MIGISPLDHFGLLGRRYIEIDDDGFLIASYQNAKQRLTGTGIDLLMRHKGRHKDKVPGPLLGDILQ